MFNTEQLQEKWSDVLDHKDCAPINDSYRRAVVSQLLENQQIACNEQRGIEGGMISENNVTTANVKNYDPVLISLVRRAMPNIIAYDIAGVQPLKQPTGLIFAMKSLYKAPAGYAPAYEIEALHNKPDTAFAGNGVDNAMTTAKAEALSGGRTTPTSDSGFGEMGFEIVKTSVEAKSKALRATYTTELAQDLKAVHGLDAESELANILSTEIMAEMNREIIVGVNDAAKTGGNAGNFSLLTGGDADGRWSVEKYKTLLFAVMKESNAIALETRRGKGNFVICSSNVASAFSAIGVLDNTTALAAMNVDPTGNLFAGTLPGGIKVFIDPFASGDYVTVGYRGSNVYDAGVFYCPYVPLTMMRAVGEDTFQPRIGFKTRYGIRANPFVDVTFGTNPTNGDERFGGSGANQYFRNFTVTGI
jgi:hypothetical protein